MKILASDGMDKSAIAELQKQGHQVDVQFYEVEDLKTVLKDYDVLVVRSATKIRVPVIDAVAGSNLKLIIRAGVGIDNIDFEYAEQKGIKVRNTPNSSSASVAELAVAHMFSLARFIGISNVTMRKGEWNKSKYTGIELNGKTLGLVGFGRIAKEVAKRAAALGMSIVYADILGAQSGCPYEFVDMDGLFAKADFISLHIPSAGKPILAEAEFAKMKKGVYIINTSRGNVICEESLLKAIESGQVAGAGLDVFAEEPTKNEALINCPKVSLTPHIGASTAEAQERVGAEVVEVITGFFK